GAITLATLLIVALPLGDTFSAVTRRYFTGLLPHSPRSHLAGFARIFQPDRNHLHHRLLEAGLGQRAATYFLYGIQAIACGYAVYLLIRGCPFWSSGTSGAARACSTTRSRSPPTAPRST